MNTKFNIHKIITERVALRKFIEASLKKGASVRILHRDQDVTSEYVGMYINRIIYDNL